MIKAVIFDLDGVLVDAKELHYEALNNALPEKFRISLKEHISTFDGLKTRQKLEMLSQKKGMPLDIHDEVYEMKQLETAKALKNVKVSENLTELFKYLKSKNIKIGVCSNSIRQTILIVLGKLDLFEYIDVIYSNEDVKLSKPSPEMYWRCMIDMKLNAEDVLIVEDSPYGLKAAIKSGANVFRVE